MGLGLSLLLLLGKGLCKHRFKPVGPATFLFPLPNEFVNSFLHTLGRFRFLVVLNLRGRRGGIVAGIAVNFRRG